MKLVQLPSLAVKKEGSTPRTALHFLNKKELFSAFHHSKTMNSCENSLFFLKSTKDFLTYFNGTPLGTRTLDPLIKSQLLYQLS